MTAKSTINQLAFDELTAKLSKVHILRESEKNGEYPMGYVIDLLKDNYCMAKSNQVTWNTAQKICNFFGV